MSTTATTMTSVVSASELNTKTTWADGPYPMIPSPLPNGQLSYKNEYSKVHFSQIMAHDMSHLHNMLIRAMNSIWQQAPQVKSDKDIVDFRQYCLLWNDFIHHHHATEEEFFFPRLETLINKPGFMDANVEQHRAFEIGLAKFKEHVEAITPANYDAAELRRLIESFANIFVTHLQDEITTLQNLKDYDDKEFKKLWTKSGEYARGHGDNASMMPLMVGTYDIDFEGGSYSEFNLPTPLYWVNDWIFSRKYAACWRFLPCDSRSHRRELAFGAPSASA